MHRRTYGWIQNPSDFAKLKKTVQIFDSTSDHYSQLKKELVPSLIPIKEIREDLLAKLEKSCTEFSYPELVGFKQDAFGKRNISRAEAVADSLIQVSIPSQSVKTTGKNWTDNWTATGYLSWALSLNFLKHDRETDTCRITSSGKTLSESADGSAEEFEILQGAILRYPPATQVLNILSNSDTPITKFHIGNQLGFKGEKGFTSYREDLMLDWLLTAPDADLRKKIRQDIEGTSDKYARMIAGWLKKLGLVKQQREDGTTESGEKLTPFPSYSITATGEHELRKSKGSSNNSIVEKYLTWEFLAVGSAESDYTRSRRSVILQALSASNSKNSLIQKLRKCGFDDDFAVIKNDIAGLNTFGIRIDTVGDKIYLRDKITPFSVPKISFTEDQRSNELKLLKEKIMAETDLDPKYYALIDIAYDGNRSRDYEIMTIDLLTNVYGFKGKLLGNSRRPDGIVYTPDFGITIDTKAYSKGYSKNISQEDEMVRYIEDNQLRDAKRNPNKWWEEFDPNIPADSHYFLWVSSQFKETFTQQLASTSARTNSKGGALGVEQLLIGADLINKGKLKLSDVEASLRNDLINWESSN
ncbi:restriction endonuclease FokI C-terminal domain-containing protein [Corynebacterium accolens]|uniref:restriction endonuclease FokI C-terminal domain-containing protein n=1 Tax=Corynebacterium accolens TaxID=38284 RepID=UPI001EDB9751|nr:restriction endonuclease FokI C-terminal domain-containing protein [Corynebacterium accolens]